MLQKLRDQTQGLFFKVLVGAIIFTLAIFGFGAFNLFMNPDPAVASVNGEDISQTRLLQEADRERRRLAMQYGENFDPDMIDPLQLQSAVLDQLIGRALLTQAAEEMEMGASPRQVSSSVAENPNFIVEGRFDQNAYRQVVQMMGYTPQTFMDVTEELIVLDQLRKGIVDSSFTTEWEVRQNARLLNQQRDLAYLAFNVADFAAAIEVSDDDVALRYEENQRAYMSEESIDVDYVELTWTDLLDDPAIEVSEEDLLNAYETDKAANPPEEKRDASHILLAVDDDVSVEEATARALELRERIEAGESFAELAEEFSDDPGSAATGGELGALGKGVFVPEFEEVLWELQEGEVSQPVTTEFGVHLIKLNRIEDAQYPEFETVRAEIDTRLRREQAEALFLERYRELDSLAFEQPDSLDGLSDSLGLDIRHAQNITRSAGSAIFGNEELRQALFTDDVLVNRFNTSAIEYVDNRAVVARVTQRFEPAVRPLEEVSETIRDEIISERAREQVQQEQAAAFARLEAGESVAEVAADVGVDWQRVELAKRNQPGVPREVLQVAFAMQRPTEGGKQIGEASGSGGDRYVVAVTRVADGDVSTMTESEIASIRGMLAQRSSGVDFEGFYNSLEADASISRPDFE